jgi:Ca2+/Na+ antiporter
MPTVMKKIADAAPAVFVVLGSGSILIGIFRHSQTIERLNEVLTWPWSAVWLATIFLGSIALLVGISLRSRTGKVGRPQIWGQGLELAGNLAVGSMFIVYAVVLNAQYSFWNIFPSLCWFGALSAAFFGPWAIIVRDIVRAHREPA